MFRLAYIVTHPIQYQAPLLRYLAQRGEIDLEVFYLSDFSLHDHFERHFDYNFKWDVGLVDGYKWEILPRTWIGPSTPLRPWLPLTGLRQRLVEGNFDAVWVHGWAHVGLCQAIETAAAIGIPVLFRGESALSSTKNGNFRDRVRASIYDQWLIPRIAGFLCIGTRNREFYQSHQIESDRLFSMPYTVDNDFFQARCALAGPTRERLRCSLGLKPGRPIVLFAGKLVSAKAPEELLSAFASLHDRIHGAAPPYLLFAGDGPLRKKLEAKARPLGDAVGFLGFRNQSALPALYDLCDLLVLPSRFEPWGLVINEAMNAARPIIVSDRVGAAPDLIENGKNGFIYPSGNGGQLASALMRLIESAALRDQMGRASRARINSWNFDADRRGLLAALSQACHSRPVSKRAMAG